MLERSDRRASRAPPRGGGAAGIRAGFFHFSTKDVAFTAEPLDGSQSQRRRRTRAYARGAAHVALPPPRVDGDLPRTLLARRTWRRFARRPRPWRTSRRCWPHVPHRAAHGAWRRARGPAYVACPARATRARGLRAGAGRRRLPRALSLRRGPPSARAARRAAPPGGASPTTRRRRTGTATRARWCCSRPSSRACGGATTTRARIAPISWRPATSARRSCWRRPGWGWRRSARWRSFRLAQSSATWGSTA